MSTALAGVLGLSPGAAAEPEAQSRPRGAPPAGRKPSAAKPKPRLIVIDPGHGGPDPGTIGAAGYYEKTVAMAASREMARQLTATGRYRVVLTRAGDSFVALRDRVARARLAKAELFVSVHADAHPDRGTRGASVYTLSEEASDREAAALAIKENKADIVAGVDFRGKPPDVASILLDLSQRETINHSRAFAGLLLDSLAGAGVGLLGRSHRYAGFAVLTAPDTPAVLLEMGYLSNRQDERLLVQAAFQRRLGAALVEAADRYFASRPVPPPPAVPARPPSASKKA
jgi:N-acetylmuramoyl-L-alanine amidase